MANANVGKNIVRGILFLCDFITFFRLGNWSNFVPLVLLSQCLSLHGSTFPRVAGSGFHANSALLTFQLNTQRDL